MILKIFSTKKSAKNWRFGLKTKPNFEKIDHNIGFLRKSHFLRRKLAKIAENCDHNIVEYKGIITLGYFFFHDGKR
jgi:hypothetical protein